MNLSIIEKVLFLKGLALFEQTPPEQLVGVAQIAHEVTFAEGETFIRHGEPGDCLYVIVEGQARVIVPGGGVIDHIGPQSILGEMAILSDQPRSADCIADTEVQALKVGEAEFWELMRQRPEIALGVIRVLVYNLQRSNVTIERKSRRGLSKEIWQALDKL